MIFVEVFMIYLVIIIHFWEFFYKKLVFKNIVKKKKTKLFNRSQRFKNLNNNRRLIEKKRQKLFK